MPQENPSWEQAERERTLKDLKTTVDGGDPLSFSLVFHMFFSFLGFAARAMRVEKV